MIISKLLPVTGLLVITSACASFELAADDVIELRQTDMKAMAAAAKTMAEMFRDPASYSSGEFRNAAGSIAARSGDVLADHFVSGLDDPKSKTKPEIGTERERFERLADDLGDYARALETAAVDNPGLMTDRMRMKPGEAMGGGPLGTHVRNEAALSSIPAEHVFHLMLQTCTTCHARFRMGQ